MNVSIALCTYNGGKWLQHQLDSLESQTYVPYELIVCDDRSSDNSIQILEDFAKRAPFPVHIHQNPENLGVRRNFTKAIGLCVGEAVAISDQDDVWLPAKLEKEVEILKSMPQVGMVVTNAQVVDAKLQSKGYTLMESARVSSKMIRQINTGMAFEVQLRRYFAWGNTMLFRTHYRDQIFPLAPHWSHDGWISMVMAAVADITLIPEPLLLYRQHGNNVAGTSALFSQEPVTAIQDALSSDWYGNMARDLRIASEHLQSIEGVRDKKRVVALIQRKIHHLEARASLPKNKVLRVPAATRELVSGRYHEYASGFKSFVKDIVV